MLHAPVVEGESTTLSPIRLRVLTLIRPRVAGFDRHQAIELSRLCAARPGIFAASRCACGVSMLPAIAQERGCNWAISYQDCALHSGDLYRFDGWVRLGVSRSGVDPRSGRRGRNR